MTLTINPGSTTIIAQCTPRGSGALALIRLSGDNVRMIIGKMSSLAGNKSILNVSSHTVHYGWVTDQQGNHIDQVLFIVMDGPKTFTGHSVIEITCHNNPFLIESIIQQAIIHGARPAQEGEFSRQAFENGKIDLIQAEAINELINANTQHALKKSLAQLEGSFSSWLVEIEDKLVHALAYCEASFEFLDEGKEFGDEVLQDINELIKTISSIKKTFDIQNHIRQGIRIALIGSVNAGKSSIFNALLNQKRAIVTDIAGTTRDVIEAGLYRNDNYWTLVDTAGLRKTNDIIEQEGIKKSWQEAQKADVILLVIDTSRAFTDDEQTVYQELYEKHQNKIVIVHNKIDAPQNNNLFSTCSPILISSKFNTNFEILETAIQEKITLLLSAIDSPFLLNERQYKILISLEQQLVALQSLLQQDIQYELVSYHLREALETLSELTGKTITELGMDRVFKEFCVGK